MIQTATLTLTVFMTDDVLYKLVEFFNNFLNIDFQKKLLRRKMLVYMRRFGRKFFSFKKLVLLRALYQFLQGKNQKISYVAKWIYLLETKQFSPNLF